MIKELKFEEPILVTRPKLPECDKYISYVKDIWNNNWVTNNGPLHNKLKKEMESYLKVKNVELFTNGHLALEVALKSLKLNGEVITTPFTFISTTNAIINSGLKPIFCDINEEDYNIDVNKIEDLITKDTCAIVAVHVFGNPCNVSAIEKIAEKYNLKVIYDAAHAFGVRLNEKGIGEYGDISMFSLHATKVYNTIEGGALTYNNSEFNNKFKMLKNFGMCPITGEILESGINAKMNEFQAAMGLCNLESIDENILERKRIYNCYYNNLKDIRGFKLINISNEYYYNYAYFPLVLTEECKISRDNLIKALEKYNVYARKYFYPACNEVDYLIKSSTPTPVASKISKSIMTLPMYVGLSTESVEQICNIIKYEVSEK